MMIGYLTTPAAVTGITLSEFWAWVRYLAAVTDGDDLRLTHAFANLDAHQKTILSDDWGMGLPMLWLAEQLDFDRICDGRYFVERVAASLNASARRLAKRGPNKTPDFVARDTSGTWHVVECKGTQSGEDYCRRQLGESGPPPTGGVAQKRAIIFPRGYVGQRLVCGLSIASDGQDWNSRLRIIDPPVETEEPPFELSEDQLEYADDAVARAMAARSLRLAGFAATADVTAAPMGISPSAQRELRPRAEERRQKIVDERNSRAEEELHDLRDRRLIIRDGRRYRGRQLTFDLPRSLQVEGQRIMSVTLTQGVNERVLREMRSRPIVEEAVGASDLDWEDAIEVSRLETDARRSQMKIGEFFLSELVLNRG